MKAHYELLDGRYSGDRFDVLRAQRVSDKRPVVLKTCRPGADEAGCGEMLRHEREILERLDFRGVARPVELTALDAGQALVLEDAGARSLAGLLSGKPLDTARFLELAVEMARIVAELHRRNVIHRNVCPDNFVLGNGVTLVGFSSATTVPAFTQAITSPGQLTGALAYLAPEQTGRTRRLVDLRADLYSLGTTFYEMLTGAPPFTSRDPLELIHAHIARAPHPPSVLNPSVPTLLSELVMKLLAKMPECRYQSAAALQVDLEEARRQWKAAGAIPSFELARFDVPHGLFADGKLYGRELQLAELARGFERASAGSREVFFLSGRAGVGKSALVQSLRATVASGWRWLEGKGDLLRGNVPYAPIADAVGGMLSALRDQPEPEVAEVRERIRKAVGPIGRVLTDAIPGLAWLLGEQAPVPAVGPVEAANRLQLAFTSFIGALGSGDAAAVLFLDDVQWADAASLDLLRAVACDPGARRLLIIAAYRSAEVGPGHPIQRAAEAVQSAGAHVHPLALRPLDEETLVVFLAEALRTTPQDAAPLAKVVWQKTAGSPFGVRRLLGHLHRTGVLVFNPQRGRWSWDLGQVTSVALAEDAVDLAEANIRSQPPATQRLLRAAACIGHQFDLAVAAAVVDEPLPEAAQALWGPLREGLILPAEQPLFPWAAKNPIELRELPAASYRFAHDRIQQAAYEGMEDAERSGLHQRIGRELWRQLPKSMADEEVCAVVDQLDRATTRLSEDERASLVELNLRAGARARATTAYASGLVYFQRGLALLSAEGWRDRHDLWFQLQLSAAECATLAAQHALAESLVEEGLARSSTLAEKVPFYAISILGKVGRGLHPEALRRGEEGLRLLGMDLAREKRPEIIAADTALARALLAGLSQGERAGQFRIADPREDAQLMLLLTLIGSAWYADVDLLRLISARAVRLSLSRGVAPQAAAACASYAVALAIDGEYAEAHQAGQWALRFSAQVSDPTQECRVLLMIGGHVTPWRQPLRDCIPLLRKSFAVGVEAGELQFSAYAILNAIEALFMVGTDLDQVIAETSSALAHFQKIAHPWDGMHAILYRQISRRLKGLTRSPGTFSDQQFDEASFLDAAADNLPAQSLYHLYRLQACYLLGDLASAMEAFQSAKALLPVFRSLFLQVDYFFYGSLVLAARCAEALPAERSLLILELQAGLKRLSSWADNAPRNWGHKRDLVTAELARLDGRPEDALAFYQAAIEGAGREGFRQDEALAHELCGRFHSSRGERQMAALHLGAAMEGYARWGASAKVEQLSRARAVPFPLRAASSLGPHASLDEASLVKVIEAITGELELNPLLKKVTHICAEAAAAERAALVLSEGELVVRAVATPQGEVSLTRTPLSQVALPAPLIERVFRSGEAVVSGTATKAEMAVPIGDPARGVLYFENGLVPDAFTPERVDLFRLLSAPIGIALHNSLLFEERRKAEAALRLIADAGAALAESLDYEVTVAKVAELAVPALADWCIVDVLEGGNLRGVAFSHVDPHQRDLVRELRRHYPVTPDSMQPQALVLRTGKPLLIEELTDERLRQLVRDQRHFELVKALNTRAGGVVPLMARGRVLGTVTFAISGPDRQFGTAELGLAQVLGRRVALAIDNARLYRDVQQAVKTRDEAILARDEFLSIASHELRTPLTSLQLAVRGLRAGKIAPTPEKIARSLALADRQVSRLGRLVEELLSVVRIDAGRLQLELQEMDLVKTVREVVIYFTDDLARAGSAVEVRAPEQLRGSWDAGKLEQVVVNLLSNAIKFGDGKPILITLEAKDGRARLRVTDHGIGVAADRAPVIFEKFERAVSSRAYGGLGLGLYITRSIVEALGGTLRVDSSGHGCGATFTVELPMSSEQTRAPRSSTRAGDAVPAVNLSGEPGPHREPP